MHYWFGHPENRKLIEVLRKAGLNFESALYQDAAGAVGRQVAGVDRYIAKFKTARGRGQN